MAITAGVIRERDINQELQDAYLDYAMSVIVGRAPELVEMAHRSPGGRLLGMPSEKLGPQPQ